MSYPGKTVKSKAASSTPVEPQREKKITATERDRRAALAERRRLAAEQKERKFKEWRQNLGLFIMNSVLKRIIPQGQDEDNADYVNRLADYFRVNPKTGMSRMGFWIEAFTDPTALEDIDYERLENHGDSAVDLSLSTMFIRRFPRATPKEMSHLITQYRSNVVFASLVKSVLPDLVKHIRIDPRVEITDSVISDVFEAMQGALFNVSQDIYYGLGPVNTMLLTDSVFQEWFEQGGQFDPDKMMSDPRSVVDGIFLRVAGNEAKQYKPKHSEKILLGNKVEVTVTITPDTVDFLNEKNQKVFNQPITMQNLLLDKYDPQFDEGFFIQESADTKYLARQNAYQRVLNYLKNAGIDDDWARRVKLFETIGQLTEEARVKLQAKMEEEGYDFADFHKIGKHTIEGRQTVVLLRMGRNEPGAELEKVALGIGTADVANENAVRDWVGLPPLVSKATSIKSGRMGRDREDKPRSRTYRRNQISQPTD